MSEWNWLTFLESAVEKEPGREKCQMASTLAGEWPTCACGSLCKDLPRELDGAPFDHYLRMLGGFFFVDVQDQDWVRALSTFHAIEARTAQLLKEAK